MSIDGTRGGRVSTGVGQAEPWMLRTRYRPGQRQGHYESFYQRANHPDRPLAFWIRYTIFSPKGRPEAAIAEIWAVLFDGETGQHVVAKEEHPIGAAEFDRSGLGARIDGSSLEPGRLVGSARGPAQSLTWDLRFSGDEAPLFLLDRAAYDRGFPSAKSLVALPLATYDGTLVADGRAVDVQGWVGSQNHNWGTRHTDHYAFGQVAGFDDAPRSFLEVVTAKVKVGPLAVPQVTCLSLRHDGRTHEFVNAIKGMRIDAAYDYFSWRFACSNDEVRLEGRFDAEPEDFVALNYYNPPGGIKTCLNTKIARCSLTITDRATGHREVLTTDHRALFEILTDHRAHGVPVRA